MVFDIYLVNVKTMRKIAQIFVAFSEKLNFTNITSLLGSFHKLRLHFWEFFDHVRP